MGPRGEHIRPWPKQAQTHRARGGAPGCHTWNPLGKVVKRFEVGEQESLPTLCLQLHRRARPRMAFTARSAVRLTGCDIVGKVGADRLGARGHSDLWRVARNHMNSV